MLKSVSVLTLIDRLAKDSGRPELRAQYDWLSDSAHPAFAAATTYSSNIAVHDSGAVHRALYTRTPSLKASSADPAMASDSFLKTVDCLQFCLRTLLDLGPQVQSFVHDCDLTTDAQLFTSTKIVRDMQSDFGSGSCDCGKRQSHAWGYPAPTVSPVKLE